MTAANFLDPRLPDRFWDKVTPCPVSGCWIWTAHTTKYGYGKIGTNRRGTFLSHRVSYLSLIGPIPNGTELDHKCRNTSCCNPLHLEPVTHRENVKRGQAGLATAARQKAKTHCPAGHEYSQENTYIHNNKRACKTCLINTRRRWRAKNKAISQ